MQGYSSSKKSKHVSFKTKGWAGEVKPGKEATL